MGREVVVLKQNYKDVDGTFKTKEITPDTDDTVKLNGDQTVGGTKKFVVTPVVGEPSAEGDNKVVIKRDVANFSDITFTERIL